MDNLIIILFVYLGMALIIMIYQQLKISNLEREINTDELTGLYNQKKYHKDLKSFNDSEAKYAIFLDMNNLKTINDTLGHDAGSEAISQMGKGLKKVVRESDKIYRFGGDEFIILLGSNISKEKALKIGQRVSSQFASQASVGMALDPEGKNPMNVVVKKADDLMYESKRNKEIELNLELL